MVISVSPIQNAKPYRLLSRGDSVKPMVVYLKQLNDGSSDRHHENITKAAFDFDLTTGYEHTFLKTLSLTRSGFFSLISFRLIKWVGSNDIIVIHGHNYLSFWIAMVAAKLLGKKIVQTTDATSLGATAHTKEWKKKLKPFFLRFIYNRLVDGVFVMSTASKLFLESVGVWSQKIMVVPYAVDEDLIEAAALNTDANRFRASLRIPLDSTCFVFCAKFILRKRPMDAIEAFAQVFDDNSYLIMIGDGPLAAELKKRCKDSQLSNRVLFPGLIQYSKLFEYYTSSDALIFTSEHEPYGLPVNEAMICGIPAVVSDKIGARLDLVSDNETGWTYKVGDVPALATIMNRVIELKKSSHFAEIKSACKKRMTTWSSVTHVNNQLSYFKRMGWIN